MCSRSFRFDEHRILTGRVIPDEDSAGAGAGGASGRFFDGTFGDRSTVED